MPTWKLPRKQKKAFIRAHGRERYLRAVSVGRLINPTISFDVGADGATHFMIADVKPSGMVHILAEERTIDQSNALFAFMRTLPKRKYTVIPDPVPSGTSYAN